MRYTDLAAIGLVALSACGDSDDIPHSDIIGIVQDNHHSETSIVGVPVNLAGYAISAYRWDGVNGFSVMTSEILDQGHFVIRDVPDNEDILLRFNTL